MHQYDLTTMTNDELRAEIRAHRYPRDLDETHYHIALYDEQVRRIQAGEWDQWKHET